MPSSSDPYNDAITDPNSLAILDPASPQYIPNDTGWMGSKLFMTDVHFYPSLISRAPVPPFTSTGNQVNNTNVGTGSATGSTSPWSWPTCQQWWGDSTYGLRQRITGQKSWVSRKFNSALASMSSFAGSTPDDKADFIAQASTFNSPPNMVDVTNTMGRNENNIMVRGLRGVGGVVGGVPVGMATIASLMGDAHTTAAIMMVQALILMCIYMLLPLIVLLSGYDLKVMFYGAMAIFTVKFWTVLWFTANWIDGHLMSSMFEGQSLMSYGQSLLDGTRTYKWAILNILLFGMYVGFPVIWSGMMSWIGVHVGGVLSNFMKANAHPGRNSTGMSIPIVGKFLK
jgi:hypothetical protein